MAGVNNIVEPSTAPQADRWYNLTLGSSFKEHNPSKFCTFRYEFKPASIDKNQRGTLHKSKDNKVTVEFQNIQPGKPKMIFEGTSEDYKDNDAVILFDGESFRLERLHRAVKRLRHNRMLSESVGAVAASAGPSDPSSPPVGKGNKHQPLIKETYIPATVEVERIEVGNFKASDPKHRPDKTLEHHTTQPNSSNPSPDPKNDDLDEQLDIMNDDDEDNNDHAAGNGGTIEVKEVDFDINMLPQQTDTDDEIADVDVSDDEGDKGPNAAEALRAQVNAQESKGQSSSSGSSSGSDSSESGSGSGSGSSSSDSDSSDADSVTSI
ncbi:hypothetical protein OROHE_019707 [Orobanche hederae]